MATVTTYETLLQDLRPRPIRSKAAYAQTLKQVEQLMTRPKLGRAASEMVELFSLLIEQYESRDYPTPGSTPSVLLQHFIEQRGITQVQLARAAGLSRSVITNVLAGRRSISKSTAIKLAQYFGVPAGLFVVID